MTRLKQSDNFITKIENNDIKKGLRNTLSQILEKQVLKLTASIKSGESTSMEDK